MPLLPKHPAATDFVFDEVLELLKRSDALDAVFAVVRIPFAILSSFLRNAANRKYD